VQGRVKFRVLLVPDIRLGLDFWCYPRPGLAAVTAARLFEIVLIPFFLFRTHPIFTQSRLLLHIFYSKPQY
jgi:hypothetical protein